jgi:hypothetical protein
MRLFVWLFLRRCAQWMFVAATINSFLCVQCVYTTGQETQELCIQWSNKTGKGNTQMRSLPFYTPHLPTFNYCRYKSVSFCGSFHDAPIVNTSGYIASNGRIIGEYWIGKDLEGSGCCLIEVLSRNLPERAEGNHENSSQGSRCSRRHSNRVPSKQKSRALPLHQSAWSNVLDFQLVI